MQDKWKRTVSGVAAAAAVVLAGTACSSSGNTGSGGTVGDSTNTTGANTGSNNGGDAGGKGLTLLAKMTAPQAVAQTTKAVSAKQTVKIHVVMKMPQMTETADGPMSYGGTPKADLTLSMDSSDPQVGPIFAQMGRMEMRMDGSIAYLYMGNSAQIRDALQGKKWMKLDFAEVADIPSLKSFSFMKDMTKSNDPSAQLDTLLASPDLKLVGTEKHDGTDALHYAGTVTSDDMIKASAAGTGLTQKDLDSVKALMQQAGVTKASYDLWVDGSGLPIAMKLSEDTNAGTVTGDITYSNWGTPVSVAAPPASDTADIADLLNGQ